MGKINRQGAITGTTSLRRQERPPDSQYYCFHYINWEDIEDVAWSRRYEMWQFLIAFISIVMEELVDSFR